VVDLPLKSHNVVEIAETCLLGSEMRVVIDTKERVQNYIVVGNGSEEPAHIT
jgi:hypothetical protein